MSSISLGLFIPFNTAFLVISLKVIRLVFSDFNFNACNKCHDIASPSLSSSVANHTISDFLAKDESSETTFF